MNTAAASIEAGRQAYFLPRAEGDIDLIAEVRQILVDAGVGPNIVHFDNDPLLAQVHDRNPSTQRFTLNRYWILQLYKVTTVNTEELRFYLFPDGDLQEWIRLFREGIAPFAVQHQLPTTL